MQDTQALGEAYFQASLIAERDGHWVLARTYAERAKAQYEELTDRMNVGRLLNNLGGLEFLLGKPEEAVARLQEAFAVALEHGNDDDVGDGRLVARPGVSEDRRPGRGRGARASRAAAARRPRGSHGRDRQRAARARPRAARAGPARRGRGGAGARPRTRSPSSRPGSHRAAAWVAQGDLAQRRGDDRQAAALYRRAAEALQDFRF